MKGVGLDGSIGTMEMRSTTERGENHNAGLLSVTKGLAREK